MWGKERDIEWNFFKNKDTKMLGENEASNWYPLWVWGDGLKKCLAKT